MNCYEQVIEPFCAGGLMASGLVPTALRRIVMVARDASPRMPATFAPPLLVLLRLQQSRPRPLFGYPAVVRLR
jgi:hypothetical protein